MQSLYLNAVESELLTVLADRRVRFLIVGGHAIQFHGHMRPAKDLDIFSEPSADNARRLASALGQLGMQVEPELEAKLSSPKKQLPLRRQYANIEILTSINSLSFEEEFDQAAHCIVNARAIPVLSKDHLIQSKLARGDKEDLDDVRALKALPNSMS